MGRRVYVRRGYHEHEYTAREVSSPLLLGLRSLTPPRNPKLLSKLSTGFTLAATTQVAGRGRGSNVWVAPPGSLLMSTVINHPAHHAATRPIVFLQYLAAVAIVEAIKSYDV